MLSKYPLDFELLEKGAVVLVETIEEVLSVSREDVDWQFRLLELCKQCESETGYVCRTEKGSIHVLTDLQADEYLAKETNRAVRKLRRDAKRTALIDRSEFSDGEKRISESRQRTATLTALAAHEAHRSGVKEIRAIERRRIEAG